jgi:hypothetical protein
MADIFAQAGFKHIGEQEMTGKIDFIDADTYWENRTDISESIIVALAKADEATIAAIKKDVYAVISTNSINGRALLDYGVNIVYCEKPL